MGQDRTRQRAKVRRRTCAGLARAGRYISQVVRREVDTARHEEYRQDFHHMVQELFATIDLPKTVLFERSTSLVCLSSVRTLKILDP